MTDTKKMLRLLRSGPVIDYEAINAGILNPRREIALIRRRGYEVTIHDLTDKKREYTLLTAEVV